MVIAKTGVAVTPPTLFVNKAAVENDQHGLFTWGAAQAGVAAGVGDALRAGVIGIAKTDDLVIVAAVWLNPSANDEEEVFRNQRQAMLDALTNGKSGKPTAAEVMKATEDVSNPFFRQK
jgi:5,6,7,8-tetrahydromethanopterin hydro-lyase